MNENPAGSAAKGKRTPHIPLDKRDPSTVRAVILARESSGPDVDTQVRRCQDFIAERGWTLVADPFAYAERNVSGVKKRPRPVLTAALTLAQQHMIDVIVASEYERVDRNSDRRAVWKATAERFGVEFRFANLPPTGKLADDMASRIVGAVRDVLGELEAERIRERTWPGRVRRFEAGLPGSGRFGPPYGFTWRPKRDGEKTYSGYEIIPDEFPRVQSWYERLDTDETVTLRQIVCDLNDAAITTPSGTGQWRIGTVSGILRHPVYSGRARLLRYATAWEKRPDEHGELWDERRTTDRLRDADAWETETLPLAAGVVPTPYLVSVERWERVQARIAHLRTNGGRLARETSTRPCEATLLHGGLARCAHCGAAMSRVWPSDSPLAYYRCSRKSNDPGTTCKRHYISARALDRLTLDLIAHVLGDPETLVAWADANESHLTDATQAVALADATVDALRTRLDDLTEDAARYRRVLAALDARKDADEIALYNVKLQQVAAAREQAQADLAAATPGRDHAREREWLFHALRYWSDPLPRKQSVHGEDDSKPLATVLAHIGDVPLLSPQTGAIADALHAMPFDLKRRLVRDLRVVALVSRPLPHVAHAPRGLIAKRVVVRVGELEVRLCDDEQGRHGAYVQNIRMFGRPSHSTGT
jgi:DNA invertase Pin-like site-specific DNA recombinase